MGSCVERSTQGPVQFAHAYAKPWGSAATLAHTQRVDKVKGTAASNSSSSPNFAKSTANGKADATQAAEQQLQRLRIPGSGMNTQETQRSETDSIGSSCWVPPLSPGLAFRRSGSESDLEVTLRQPSITAAPPTQTLPSSLERSHTSFLHARRDPRARWRWAFQMTKLLGRGSGRKNAVILLPEHWLEVQHPAHRSHLKPYFKYWTKSDTKESFFYWLDKGEGMKLDLPERPRAQLENNRVRYCGPEIALLEVSVHDGLLKYTIGKRVVHTPIEPEEEVGSPVTATSMDPGEKPPKSKWIYVLDLHNRMFINKKQAGEFHHSSFTRGGPVKAAGSILVDHGVVRQITAWSGHYRPSESDFDEAISYLESQGIDMSRVDKLLTKSKAGSKMGKSSKSKEAEDSVEGSGLSKSNLNLRRMSAPPRKTSFEKLVSCSLDMGAITINELSPRSEGAGLREEEEEEVSSKYMGQQQEEGKEDGEEEEEQQQHQQQQRGGGLQKTWAQKLRQLTRSPLGGGV